MKALYAGSFDPPHLGHLDVIRRAARICERLVVAVASNPDKKPFLPALSRVEVLRGDCAQSGNVEIVQINGATVHWAKANAVNTLIRGLRGPADLEAETAMAAVNRSQGFETLFLVCDPALSHVSSRMIRQVLAAGLPTDGLISQRAYDAIRRWTAP